MDASPKARTGQARAAALSDSALKHLRDDGLGFAQYVRTLAEIVRHPDTTTPLTVSIEGRWGSGKSTFLNFMREQLEHEGDAVVVFDAWRHQESDTLLSDFALELTRQLRHSVAMKNRLVGSMRLWISRFEWYEALPILIALALYSIAFGILVLSAWHIIVDSGNLSSDKLLKMLLRSGGAAGFLIVAARGVKLSLDTIGKASIDIVAPFARKPGYDVQSAFRERAIRDINRIVDAWGRNRRIYVMIDDLDRCSPSGISEIIRALNIITSAPASNLVFFIGMDRPMVVASLATQMSVVSPFLSRLDNAGDSDQRDRTLALAHEYLDKFITLPFRVPSLEERDVSQLVVDFNATTSDHHANRLLRRLPPPVHDNDSQEVRHAVKSLAFVLEGSPRMMKRFVNLLRLSDKLVAYFPGRRTHDQLFFNSQNSQFCPLGGPCSLKHCR